MPGDDDQRSAAPRVDLRRLEDAHDLAARRDPRQPALDAGDHPVAEAEVRERRPAHDLVIGFPESDLTRVATAMMALADRPRPRLALVMAPLKRHLFAFVWLPRDMMSTAVRLRIEDLLDGLSTPPGDPR